jgi:hypothetical protein
MIGAAGTATAFGIARTLRTTWEDDIEIVAADMRPRHLIGSVVFSDSYVNSPAVDDPGYPEWLAATLRDVGATLYVPLIDADIVVAAELLAAGELGDCDVAAPPLSTARTCCDKLETYRWLSAAGVPTPETWLPAEAPARDGLVLKSRRGQGSVGFRHLSGAAEVEALRGAEDIVLQAPCEFPEVTVDAFLAADGDRFRAICRERIEVKAGVCTKARVFEDEGLAALAERIGRGLDFAGGFCLQVMRAPGGGEWRVTDLNARPGAGGRLSTAAGVDVLGAVYADHMRAPFDYEARTMRPLDEDVYVIRQFDEYIID